MELDLLRYIQSAASSVLDVFFSAAVHLADPALWLLLLLWLYWREKEAGRAAAYAVFTSTVLGRGLRGIFRLAGPAGEEGIRALLPDTGPTFPSDRVQRVAAGGSALSLWQGGDALWIGSIAAMFLTAFGEMYLGGGYPRDVFVGLLLGVAVAWLCARLRDRALGHVGLYAASWAVLTVLLPFGWSEELLAAWGLLGGFAAGCAFEENFVRVGRQSEMAGVLFRLVTGTALTGGIYALGGLLPESAPFAAVRLFATGFAGYGLCPMLFKKLRR